MVSLKALKPGKFKGRGKNAILSVITAACSGAAAWDGDMGLRSGSTKPCRPQWAQGETLSSPWAELSTAKNILIHMYGYYRNTVQQSCPVDLKTQNCFLASQKMVGPFLKEFPGS